MHRLLALGLLVSALLVSAVATNGCATPPPEELILGTWYGQNPNNPVATTFGEDGDVTIELRSSTLEGSWSLEGDTLSMDIGGQRLESSVTVLTGDELEITDTGTGETSLLRREPATELE
jgi:hypothetical protein